MSASQPLDFRRTWYYNVTSARFLTEDSYLGDIAEPLTLNRYNYCVSSWLNYRDPSGYVIRELTELFFNYGQARWEYEKSKILGYYSAVVSAGYNLVKPIGLTGALMVTLLTGNSEIVINVWDTYERNEETAIRELADLAENTTAFYVGRCEGDVAILLASEIAAADGINGVLTGGAALAAEGASGVGSVIIPGTAVYTAARAVEAMLGIVFTLTTPKTLGEDIVRLSEAQKQQKTKRRIALIQMSIKRKDKIMFQVMEATRGAEPRWGKRQGLLMDWIINLTLNIHWGNRGVDVMRE